MKIRVTLKDPDGFYESVQEAVEESLNAIPGLSKSERVALLDARMDETWEKLERWVEYKEYVSIEFDTEAETATVAEQH